MHTLKVKCFKQSCPRLECALADQHRPGPLSCCKQCRPPDSDGADSRAALDLVPIDPRKQHDMGVARTGDDILASGGCKLKGGYHENGATWHPNVLPWGEMKCFTCHCKVIFIGQKGVPKMSVHFKTFSADSMQNIWF